ncbi:MAG: hypothetical protein H7Y27_02255 [Gemmatimonadaceae bacterium]|nr:hypothetical protein [Chitinophagaceae bacterium]
MKKLYFVIVMLVAGTAVFAQSDRKAFSFDVGGELAFAIGDFSKTHSVGIGASAQAEYALLDQLSLVGHIGVNNFFGKSLGQGTNYKNAQIVPLRVGAKYYATDNFHAGGQLGAAIVRFTTAGVSSRTAFAFSPQVGYQFGEAFDATAKFDVYAFDGGTFTSFGVRLAYILGGR